LKDFGPVSKQAMSPRQKIFVAAVGLLGITILFLFPLQWGSFTATHGPATALRAKHLCLLLLLSIACLAVRVSKFPVALQAPRALANFSPTDLLLSPPKLTCSLLC
jgi:hypothetical protein